MRTVKIVLWIILLLIVKTVFVRVIGISGIMPELLMAFAVIFAFHERRLSVASYVIIICGAVAGAGIGESFPVLVLVTGAAGITAYRANSVLRFIPKYIRCATIVAAASIIYGVLRCLLNMGMFQLNMIFESLIPYVIYTTIAACIIYPLIIKTLFKEDKSKKYLIV